jgi:hypothetical protein
MPTSSFFKYHSFVDELSKGGHNLQTATFKCALTNTAPSTAHTVWNTTNAPPPAAANGYTAGGNTLTKTSSATVSGVFALILQDTTFTAGVGGMGPFRYAIVYNASAGDKVVGYYDNGSSVTLAEDETFETDLDETNGMLTLS